MSGVQYYRNKDAIKFSICNSLITRGARGSSSHLYMTNPPVTAYINGAKEFEPTDIVGISVNGKRRGRIGHDVALITKAAEASVTFVTDNEYNTNRPYNIGEQEVAKLLTSLGYKLTSTNERGTWRKP